MHANWYFPKILYPFKNTSPYSKQKCLTWNEALEYEKELDNIDDSEFFWDEDCHDETNLVILPKSGLRVIGKFVTTA